MYPSGFIQEKNGGLLKQWAFHGTQCKESTCNTGDMGSIPGMGRSPGEGNGNSVQYSRLGNPKDRGAWWATVHGLQKSWTGLSN